MFASCIYTIYTCVRGCCRRASTVLQYRKRNQQSRRKSARTKAATSARDDHSATDIRVRLTSERLTSECYSATKQVRVGGEIQQASSVYTARLGPQKTTKIPKSAPAGLQNFTRHNYSQCWRDARRIWRQFPRQIRNNTALFSPSTCMRHLGCYRRAWSSWHLQVIHLHPKIMDLSLSVHYIRAVFLFYSPL